MAPDASLPLPRNLTALAGHDPALSHRIARAEALPAGTLTPSRAGPPTARLTDPSGAAVQLASSIDPQREARRLVDAHLAEGPVVYVIIGLGLGYHVAELLACRGPQDFVVVAEGNLSLIRSAFERFDWSADLAAGRLIVLADTGKGVLYRRLLGLAAAILMGSRLIVHPPSARLLPDFAAAFRKAFVDLVAAWRLSLATAATNSAITALNLLLNLRVYATCPGVGGLKDRFAGYPAVIVSAGPSLARNVHLLPQAAGRAVIICVPPTLKMLRDRGPEPDLVVCLDYHEVSKRYFEGLPADIRTHLVIDPKVTWHVPNAWPGPMSVLGHEFLDLCLRDVTPPISRERLPAGSTVAHLAFYLAQHLGADPIIFVGQDLGYSDGLYYMPGTAAHDLWRPELNRFWTLEMREWERIVRMRPMLRTIEDVHGRPIYTDDQMFTYLQRFEVDFSDTSARVIDATEGGAKKAGAECMALAEALATFATRPLPAEAVDRLRRPLEPATGRLPEAVAALRRRRAEIEHLRDVCTASGGLLEQLRDVLDVPAKVRPIVEQLEAMRVELDRNPEAYRLITAVGQLDQLRRFQTDRLIAGAGVQGLRKHRRQVDRDLAYATGLAEACGLCIQMLDRAIDRAEGA